MADKITQENFQLICNHIGAGRSANVNIGLKEGEFSGYRSREVVSAGICWVPAKSKEVAARRMGQN
jgi:hypothetical protein